MNTMENVKGNPLGYAPIGKLIAKFAIPAIISMMISSVYNITDQIFIGNVVGMLGNAATNVSFPIVTLTTACSVLIGVGTAANFNINMGAKRPEEAKSVLGTGLCTAPLAGLVILLVAVIFKEDILNLCGATEKVLPYALKYFSITAIGLPFLLFSNAAAHLIRADGSPTFSMGCNIVGACLNIFLDWLFMYRFGRGIEGAAVATVISQIIAAILAFAYFFRFRTFKIERSILKPKIKNVLKIFRLGVPNFVNLSIMMLVNIVLNNTLTFYGRSTVYGSDIPLAVSGVVAKLNSILGAFTVGLSQGCQPIFSFNMGAKNYGRVKKTYKTALVISLCFGIVFFSLFQLFPRTIVSIFGSGEELYFEFADKYMRIYMMMVCVMGVQPLSINYFSGTGNTGRGLFLSLSRQGLFLIPLLIILPLIFGLNGVLVAGPVADFAAFVFSLALVFSSFKKLKDG